MERPTWSNYGTHDSSARPWLWDGCVMAAAPCLGPTGSRLYDMSGYGRHGTLTSMDPATDWVVHDGSYSLDFDNTDYVDFGTWPVGLNDATISVWVYSRDSVNGSRIVDNRYDTGFYVGVGSTSTTVSGGYVAAGSPFGSNGTIVANAWNHIALTRSGTTNRVFINGSNASSSDYTGGSGATTTAVVLRLGGSYSLNATEYFDGRIDDFRIYRRCLASSEIKELAEFRGAAYQPRSTRRYFYQSDAVTSVTGTAAVTLDNHTSSASGTGAAVSGVNRLASVSLSQALSAPLSIG